MREWLLAVAASALIGCAAQPKTTAVELTSPRLADAAAAGEAADDHANNGAAGPEGSGLLIEAGLFCNCDKTEAALADALDDYDDLKRDVLTDREGLKYVELLWIKKALVTLRHYDFDALRKRTHDKVILAPDYDDLTIAAVKKFQCGQYPRSSKNKCDALRTNGWITFPEARHAICTAGEKGEDETALHLALWYAYGQVFGENLVLSEKLVNKLLANLKTHLQHKQQPQQNGHFYPESYYEKLESRAQVFKAQVEGLINKRAGERGMTAAKFRQAYDTPLNPQTACRSLIQDLK